MDRNPYAPPQSAVADIAAPEAPLERPRQVTIAVAILWLGFFVGLLWLPISYRALSMTTGALAGALAGMGINLWLIVKISQGRNWARIVFLAGALIDLAIRVYVLSHPAQVKTVQIIASVVEIPLVTVPLYLLFIGPGQRWFKR
jgi:hypothetical protein